MKKVFLSHATTDTKFVEVFVDFLVDGIGVPASEIFCSSLPAFGIPTGQNFIEYMRSQIDGSLIVITLLSPSYMASGFCQAELGAAWVKATEVFPIVIPPTTFSDVSGVMLGKQAMKVDDDIRYNELRDRLTEVVGFSPVKPMRWDQKRKQFLEALPALLAGLAKPKIVPLAVHEEILEKYNEALNELEAQEQRINILTEENAELGKLKTPEEVSAVKAKYTDTTIADEFVKLIENAKRAIAALGGKGVRFLYLADRYGKPFDNRDYDAEQFDSAVRKNILYDDYKPMRKNRLVMAADNAVQEASRFFVKNEADIEEFAEQNFSSPLEFDNEEFWNEHLL